MDYRRATEAMKRLVEKLLSSSWQGKKNTLVWTKVAGVEMEGKIQENKILLKSMAFWIVKI